MIADIKARQYILFQEFRFSGRLNVFAELNTPTAVDIIYGFLTTEKFCFNFAII